MRLSSGETLKVKPINLQAPGQDLIAASACSRMEAFSNFDTYGDGTIGVDDLSGALEAAGCLCAKAYLDNHRTSRSDTGRIDFMDFAQLVDECRHVSDASQ